MKPSEAMLKGFEMAGFRQCVQAYFVGEPTAPTAVCAVGAILLATTGDADGDTHTHPTLEEAREFFAGKHEWLEGLNNGWCGITGAGWKREPMSIPDIAGILAAEGL